jgi:ABC-type dipeptide/oligopeptide/nickel transport system permease component
VGDLGESYQFRKPSIEVVWQAVPATLQLTAFALLVTVLIGIPLGILSAKFRGSIFDLVVSTITLIGQSMPNFWLGILLILLFSVHWGVMPTSGRGDFAQMIMPALTLAAHPISKFTRLARAEFLDQFGQDYVRTARAKGLRESLVIFRHILRNAALPIITLIGTDLGYLLSGAVIVETVFAWPGLGRLTIQAIERRDFPLVQACVLFSALMVVLVSILMDVIYSWTDPRVRLG